MTAQDIERIFDRERLRKSRRRWRIFGILVLLAGIAAALSWDYDWARHRDHVARLRIDGLITGDEATLSAVRAIGRADHARALILRIDSPGGTTAGSEALYEELRNVAKVKPVVAVMDTVAASGGYITAIAADHIVARGNTITGSIGVIFSFPEVSKLLDTLGVKMEEIKSGELKAEPTPYKPMSDRVRAVSNEMVQDAFAWFVGLVSERRGISLDQTRILADGRVYTGRQALKEKLVDELGGETEAIAWLAASRDIDPGLAVVDWRSKETLGRTGLGFSLGRKAFELLGLADIGSQLDTLSQCAKLDGLLVLWHP